MSDLRQKWAEAVERKSSLLCVGIDPSEAGQRSKQSLPAGINKVDWTIEIIDRVAPYTAAIKLNRNYYKDVSRAEMQMMTTRMREHGMLSIDDTKLADIGDTNAAAIYHAVAEGYDSLTYAPFPGNTQGTAEEAKRQKLGLIMLVLMSNPEYQVMKDISVKGQAFYQFLAQEAVRCDVEGVVIGAPSAGNHITMQELDYLAERLKTQLILVPGIGAQGGDIAPILHRFGKRTMVNVGRGIIYASDPAKEAKAYRDAIASELAQF